MDNKRCHCCDRSSHSLLTANCGHKTCFHCIKNNKPGHKCKKCNERGSQSHSPIKNKSNQKANHLQSQQTKHGASYSPFMETDRYGGVSGRSSKEVPRQVGQILMCPDHKEPLNMFCRSTKQILCSVCLCRKSKYSQQILPLRNAQQFLRKQNKIFRQQARVAQSDVQNAWRVVNKNRQVFQQSIQNHTIIINSFYDNLVVKLRQMQQNSVKLCRDYLSAKISQYGQISEDLNFLSQTLKQYRQNSKDNNSLNQLAYFYTSFNVIKKTLETLSFDYVPYDKKQIMLIQLDKQLTERVQRQLIKFRFNLQIKNNDKSKSKSRSGSINSAKKRVSPDNLINSKHKISDQSSGSKKHKFSLCSHGSVDYDNDDANLYKRLLKQKYKF